MNDVLEQKLLNAIEIKSGEVISPANDANWYNANGTVSSIRNFAVENSNFLKAFSEGYLGENLPASYPVPYDITNYKARKKTVWADTGNPTRAAKAMSDAKGTVTQTSLIFELEVADEMIRHATDTNLKSYVEKKGAEAMVNSIINMMINGDTTTAATGNVNSDDQAPATTFADGANDDSLTMNGMRYAAIANSKTYSVADFDSDDIKAVDKKLAARYSTKVNKIVRIVDPSTYNTILTDDAIKLALNTRMEAGIDSGERASLFGSELIQTEWVPLTEADGKCSATAANNVKGQIISVYAPAVVYGFGSKAIVETERVAGYGYRLVFSMEFGFTILDAANSVALGINVTV